MLGVACGSWFVCRYGAGFCCLSGDLVVVVDALGGVLGILGGYLALTFFGLL